LGKIVFGKTSSEKLVSPLSHFFISGPIVRMYNDVLKMVGIAAYIVDRENCARRYPSYYTKLTDHFSWILAFSAINGSMMVVIHIFKY